MSDSPLVQIQDWYQRIPPITRVLVTLAVGLGTAHKIGFGLYPTYFDWDLIIQQFQLWRLFTGFFADILSLTAIFQWYFFTQFSSELEKDLFNERKGDGIFFVGLIMVGVALATFYMPFFNLFPGLMSAILYVWSRRFPTQPVTLYFGIRFPGAYLPWVFMAIHFLMDNPTIKLDAIGIVVGHFVNYLTVENRSQPGGALLKTPGILVRWFGGENNPTPVSGRGRPARNAGGGHPWGHGHRLGG
ncbi:hypothetical protein H4R33_002869 [Dimargaris cristalligena]|uniref:Derlin n=1 Tax=Dimargaris cristalligena TaxID=215637 RepID=A0A4V1J576_9FUNG|nr:hypothetical protein H4R33_002869 [Dimargaris cristalligena]RKP38089.1 Der1-like family-domain-containing protein [Dimargaris cristalligena]|eukprot:RKP38089.1 Der1-like family-domain-containing protein [Dimargaris cristalligena]